MQKYESAATIKKVYSISSHTLRNWADDKKIGSTRMIGGKRLYSLADISSIFGIENTPRVGICYARVSSSKQKEDLQRQADDLKKLYPSHELITDVGSALNFKRKGLLSLLEKVTSDLVEEVVVLHKDRLCRFGFELIEYICNKHNTKIIIHNESGTSDSHRELADDLLAVTNYFVAKNNGLRSASNKRRRTEIG
jgi:putative resolvase